MCAVQVTPVLEIRSRIGEIISQMPDNSGVHIPVELGPVQNAYIMVSCAVGFPALFWFVGLLLGKSVPIQLLGICVAGTVFMILYMKNMRIRLDEVGISQGFWIFRTFIRYETVAGVHREVRSYRGASTTVLVVSQQDSVRRIVIPLRSFDQIKLSQIMAVLKHKAPQAHIKNALAQINP
jgi:hypothetical protein